MIGPFCGEFDFPPENFMRLGNGNYNFPLREVTALLEELLIEFLFVILVRR